MNDYLQQEFDAVNTRLDKVIEGMNELHEDYNVSVCSPNDCCDDDLTDFGILATSPRW